MAEMVQNKRHRRVCLGGLGDEWDRPCRNAEVPGQTGRTERPQPFQEEGLGHLALRREGESGLQRPMPHLRAGAQVGGGGGGVPGGHLLGEGDPTALEACRQRSVVVAQRVEEAIDRGLALRHRDLRHEPAHGGAIPTHEVQDPPRLVQRRAVEALDVDCGADVKRRGRGGHDGPQILLAPVPLRRIVALLGEGGAEPGVLEVRGGVPACKVDVRVDDLHGWVGGPGAVPGSGGGEAGLRGSGRGHPAGKSGRGARQRRWGGGAAGLRPRGALDCVLLPGWVPFTYSAPHNCVGWVGANYDARPGLVGVGGWWPQLALPPSEP